MSFQRLAAAALCAAAMAVQMFAADINGKWTAAMQGRNGQSREMTYNLKTDGGKLTGTVSSPMGEREIEEGKVDGDNISFAMTMNMQGESRKMLYTGKVEGDEIRMTMKVDGADFSRDFVAKRAK